MTLSSYSSIVLKLLSVDHPIMMGKLASIGVVGSLIHWISLLTRLIGFYPSVPAAVRSVVSGVPWGSVLGPRVCTMYWLCWLSVFLQMCDFDDLKLFAVLIYLVVWHQLHFSTKLISFQQHHRGVWKFLKQMFPSTLFSPFHTKWTELISYK